MEYRITSDDLASTSKLVREARKKAGITQKELASRLGISQARISQIESEGTGSISRLAACLEAMGAELAISSERPTSGDSRAFSLLFGPR